MTTAFMFSSKSAHEQHFTHPSPQIHSLSQEDNSNSSKINNSNINSSINSNSSKRTNIERLLCSYTVNHSDDLVSNEDLKLELVTFPYPVYLTELRIIPIGKKMPGSFIEDKLSETVPDSFSLTSYVNNILDIKSNGFDTFGKIQYNGTLNCSIKAIQRVATTKLIIHGSYTSISLCLYGYPALPPNTGVCDPSHPIARSTPSRDKISTVSDSIADRTSGSVTPSGIALQGRNQPGSRSWDDRLQDETLLDEIADNTEGDASTRGSYKPTSDIVMGDASTRQSPSSNADESLFGGDVTEADLLVEESWSVSFNPYHCNFSPLKHFCSLLEDKAPEIHLIDSVIGIPRHKPLSSSLSDGKSKWSRLRELTRKNKTPSMNEKFVSVLEETVKIGINDIGRPETGEANVLAVLCFWTKQVLDITKIRDMPVAANVRSMRGGLQLLDQLVQTGKYCIRLLVKYEIIELLLSLFEDKIITSSMKLRTLNSLSRLLQEHVAMERFLGYSIAKHGTRSKNSSKSSHKKNLTGYQRVIHFLSLPVCSSGQLLMEDILFKCHVYEMISNIQNAVDDILSYKPNASLNSTITTANNSNTINNSIDTPQLTADLSGEAITLQKVLESTSKASISSHTETTASSKQQTQNGKQHLHKEMQEKQLSKSQSTTELSTATLKSKKGDSDFDTLSLSNFNPAKVKDELDEDIWAFTTNPEVVDTDYFVDDDTLSADKNKEDDIDLVDQIDDSLTKDILLSAITAEHELNESGGKSFGMVDEAISERVCSNLVQLKKFLSVTSDTLRPRHLLFRVLPNELNGTAPKKSLVNLIRLIRGRSLLQCLFVLLSSHHSTHGSKIFSSVRDILLLLVRGQTGMLYLLEEYECTNGIIRLLTQSCENNAQLNYPLSEFIPERKLGSPCTPDNLGYILFYHLQVLQLVDEMRGLIKQISQFSGLNYSSLHNVDNNECFRVLNTLYMMTITHVGKYAVIHVLSLDDNLIPLLQLLEPGACEFGKEFEFKPTLSVSSHYVVLILKSLIHYNERVDYLLRNVDRIVKIADNFKDPNGIWFAELVRWIDVFKIYVNKENTNEEKISLFVKNIELSLDNFSLLKLQEVEPIILMNLRLLTHFLKPDPDSYNIVFPVNPTELLLHIIEVNGISIFNQLAQKISEMLLNLWIQNIALKPGQTHSLISIALNTVFIIKHICRELILLDSIYYNNSAMLNSLFQLYTVMTSTRNKSEYYSFIGHMTSRISDDIIVICTSFLTETMIPSTYQTEAANKIEANSQNSSAPTPEYSTDKDAKETSPIEQITLWNFFIQELFKFSLSLPQYFATGIKILCQLLPIPLPIYYAGEPISEKLLEQAQELRKTWSTILSKYVSECKQLIKCTAGSSCVELHEMTSRFACQVGDLSAQLAISIIKQLKEMLFTQLDEDSNKKENKGRLSGRSIILLGTLAVVLQQPSLKAAFLECMKENFDALMSLCEYVTSDQDICHTAGKSSILMILSAVCSPYLNLVATSSDNQTINGLPSNRELGYIVLTLLKHITMKNPSFSLLHLSLRTLVNLTLEQGMAHFYKYIVEEKSFNFQPVFENFLSALQNLPNTPEIVGDLLTCVSVLIEFIESLTSLEYFSRNSSQTSTSQASSARKYSIPAQLIHSQLVEEKDYLALILSTIKEMCEGHSVEGFSAHITTLKDRLSDSDHSSVIQNEPFPEMQTDSLEVQFETRIVSLHTANNFYSPEFWLSTPPYDQNDVKVDLTPVYLGKQLHDLCPSFNLNEETHKLLQLTSTSSTDQNLERHKRMRTWLTANADTQKKFKQHHSSSSSVMPLPYNQSQSVISRRDIFRPRKANTSRPPSLHVDEFLRIEQQSIPKQPSLLQRAPIPAMSYFSQMPANLFQSHYPGRIQGMPLSAHVISPMMRPWAAPISTYPQAIASHIRPQPGRMFPNSLPPTDPYLHRHRVYSKKTEGKNLGFVSSHLKPRSETKSYTKTLTTH